MLAAVHEPLISVARISVAISREGRTKWMWTYTWRSKLVAWVEATTTKAREKWFHLSDNHAFLFMEESSRLAAARRATKSPMCAVCRDPLEQLEISVKASLRYVFIFRNIFFLNKWNSDAHTIFFLGFARTRTETKWIVVINRAKQKEKCSSDVSCDDVLLSRPQLLI